MENIFTLIGMTLVLVLMPGPNVALIVANKVCGSFMIFAGLGLALTNDDSTN